MPNISGAGLWWIRMGSTMLVALPQRLLAVKVTAKACPSPPGVEEKQLLVP